MSTNSRPPNRRRPIEPIKQSPPAGTHTSSRPPNRDLHFDLSWLGPSHETEPYTLHIGGGRHLLSRHTPETLTASSAAGAPTHFAAQVMVQAGTVGLAYVTGPNSPRDSRPWRRSASTRPTTPAAIQSTTWRRPWCS